MIRTTALFVATAVAESVGCYLPYLWLREDRSRWILAPGAAALPQGGRTRRTAACTSRPRSSGSGSSTAGNPIAGTCSAVGITGMAIIVFGTSGS